MLIKYYELIREYMTSDKYLLDKNTSGFQAAMDIIGDTYSAMYSYKRCNKNNVDQYLSYVFIYGILNILELQQDALKAIYQCLLGKQFRPDKDEILKRIREIRNKAISHSVEYISRENKFQGYGIIRGLLSIEKFTYYSFDGSIPHTEVDVFQIIKEQEQKVTNVLAEICKELNLIE